MKTDRELLELAAKAAFMRVKWEEVHGCYWIVTELGMPIKTWEPLNDDGDALRLAIDLDLEIYIGDDEGRKASYVAFFLPGQDRSKTAVEHHDNHPDPHAATRRAITRAAAAMAENMHS